MKTVDLRKSYLRTLESGDVVITTKGFEFELYLKDGSEEIWLDKHSGLKWYPKDEDTFTRSEALALFSLPERRLPTVEEFEDAENHGFREVLPGVGNWFWSSSSNYMSKDFAPVFNGVYGEIGYEYYDDCLSILTVSQ